MANSIGSKGAFLSGAKTVSAAGTAEALASAFTLWKSVVVVAKRDNSGQVYIGGSDVASSTNGGLYPGDAIPIKTGGRIDLSDTYIDVDTNGDGVDFYASV